MGGIIKQIDGVMIDVRIDSDDIDDLNTFDKVIATHGGRFHTDELIAIATLLLQPLANCKNICIIRSRDRTRIQLADYVLDVGGMYDPVNNRFDHHAIDGFSCTYPDNTSYATAGLVWMKYGEDVLRHCIATWLPDAALPDVALDSIYDAIADEFKIADNLDNGIPVNRNSHIHRTVMSMNLVAAKANLPRLENLQTTNFITTVEIMVHWVRTLILNKFNENDLSNVIDTAISSAQGLPYLIFPTTVSVKELATKFRSQIAPYKFIIQPSATAGRITIVPIQIQEYPSSTVPNYRVPFPERFRNKYPSELAAITGIEDLWISRDHSVITAKTLDEAILLVRQLLQD